MYSRTISKVSKDVFSNYLNIPATLLCHQLLPYLDLKYNIPPPIRDTAFLMFKPNSDTLSLYQFSNQRYTDTLSKLGDNVDSDFNFDTVTDKKLFLAIHRHGHFYQKINIKKVMEDITRHAQLYNGTFLLQLDSIDLDLSSLYRTISKKLDKIRKPIKENGKIRDYKEKGTDIDRDGDKILKALKSGPCSSIVIWCFSDVKPNIGFGESDVEVHWLEVNRDVISRNIKLGNKIINIIGKPKRSKISDIFYSNSNEHSMPKFDVKEIIKREKERYLKTRKNSPVFLFDGDIPLLQSNIQSSKSVDSDNQTSSESFEGVGY